MHWATDQLRDAELIITTGVGKSGDVARLGASLLQSVGVRAMFVHATDLLHGGLGIATAGGGVMIGVSHSGKTEETVAALTHWPYQRWLITSMRDSWAGHADHIISYDIERDGSKHGTIPVFSSIKQIEIFGEWACALADEMSPAHLLEGHPNGQLSKHYLREMTK